MEVLLVRHVHVHVDSLIEHVLRFGLQMLELLVRTGGQDSQPSRNSLNLITHGYDQ